MWMEFTPKDWFMMRVELVFRDGDPDPEDAWIRAYLDEHQLEPRYRAKEERHGISCEVLYFGQCYLGHHLQTIQGLYQKGIERSFLLEKLRELRQNPNGTSPVQWPTTLDVAELERVFTVLAEALHEQVTFGTDAEGNLTVALDPDLVGREVSRLTTAEAPTAASDLST
ncbi:MAG TPA: hypothetical protein VNP04_13925 [Alphaproteobacteria bacterium]|nr:hypothetical protein [Alphaproteobacteria bacterium]